MSEKLAPTPEIELTRLSSRGRSWRKAKAEAKAKYKYQSSIGDVLSVVEVSEMSVAKK